jgi:DNA-binding NtrC family response regulator
LQAKAEIDSIRYALTQTNNNKSRAAKLLGIHRTHLYRKMNKYNIALSPQQPR